jgi:L-alanine-DL-glutamate epimerase-like enolase superfamily enzyme
MTAIDLPALIGGRQAGFSFPLNVAVAGDADPDLLRGQVERHLAAGRKYVKAKVGRNLAAECAAAALLLAGEFAHPFKVVFDANQAYSPEDAMHFSDALAALPRDRLLWLEQPVDRADWDAMSRVCAHARIPIVLDEAIYDEIDIRKAAAMSAFGVKLKLVKNFGPRRTLELARFARDLGLDVVFGNGVATDIGNFAEALTLAAERGLFSAPCECSGFQKLVRPLLPGLIAENDRGEIVLTHEGPLAETAPLDEMLL